MSSTSAFVKFLTISNRYLRSLPEFALFLAEAMRRTLAPLRKIAARDIEVFSYFQKSIKPHSFVIHDRLECGHEHTSLSWDFRDLICAYSTNPEVSARRRRCQPCLELLAKPKPVQSVKLAARVEVA